MKVRSLLVVGGLVVVGLAAATFADPYHRISGKMNGDSFHEGRPLRWWDAALSSSDPVEQAYALERVRIVTHSIPFLQDIASRATKIESRLIAISILSEQKDSPREYAQQFAGLLEEKDPTLKAAAAKGLDKLGVCPASAIPELLKMLDDDRTRIPAIRALAKTTSANEIAVAPLIELLKHPTPEVRWQASRTLGKMGEVSKPAVPGLIVQMRDPEWEVREHAAEACGGIGPDAASAVPDLIRLMGDENHKVRRDAVRALGNVGPEAVAGLEAAKKLTTDSSDIVKEAATKTVMILEGPGKK